MNFFTYPATPFISGFEKRAKELVVGGKADGKPSSDFPADQIAMGKKVEREHTDSPSMAEEIAKDHLTEDKKYYTHLKEMEDKYVKKAEEKHDTHFYIRTKVFNNMEDFKKNSPIQLKDPNVEVPLPENKTHLHMLEAKDAKDPSLKAVIGYARVTEIKPGVRMLDMLHITPSVQNQGAGTQLLEIVRSLHPEHNLLLRAEPRHNKPLDEKQLHKFYDKQPFAKNISGEGKYFTHVLYSPHQVIRAVKSNMTQGKGAK